MKYIVSKGLVYNKNEDNTLTIYNNNKLFTLSKGESIVWNLFSWEPKSQKSLNKHKLHCENFIIEKLLEKKLITISPESKDETGIFYCLASCRIKPLNISLSDKIKSKNYKRMIIDFKLKEQLTEYDKMIYTYISDYNGEMSMSDIVLAIDNKLFTMDYFTNGYTDEYIQVATTSISANRIKDSIINLLKARLIYLA